MSTIAEASTSFAQELHTDFHGCRTCCWFRPDWVAHVCPSETCYNLEDKAKYNFWGGVYDKLYIEFQFINKTTLGREAIPTKYVVATNKMNWFLPLQEDVLINKEIFEIDVDHEIHIDTGKKNDLRYGTIPDIAISRVESEDEQLAFRVEFYTNKVIMGQYKRVLKHYNNHTSAKTLIADVEDYIEAKHHSPKKIFCAVAEMVTCNLLISVIEDVRQNLLLRMVFPTSKHSKKETFPTTLEPGLVIPLSHNGFYIRSDFIKVVKPNKEYIELTSTNGNIRDFVVRESGALISPNKIASRLEPPQDVLFTVLKTIETWCKEEAEQWKFPSTVIFYYTWRGWQYDAIHATREINEVFIGYSIRIAKRDMHEQVFYFDTYDGIIVGNDLVRSDVDTAIWNRNKQTEAYRQAIIHSLQYTSNVPKSLHGVCNTQTVLQRYNECWYIAAVVLASKTIYELVMENTKKFLQTYRQYTQPISAKGSALLIPEEIALCYRNKFNTSSVFISHFLNDGGFELQLFEAILDINMIPYHSYKYITTGLPVVIEYIPFPKESSYLLLTYSTDRSMSVRGHTWDVFIRRVVDTYKSHTHAVLGGMISMNEGKHDTSHAISFTVCAGRTIICNYGKCFETITDTSNLDMELLEDITFLIEKTTKKKNTLEMEASELENNFNHVHLSLVQGNLTLTVRITNVRQDNIRREQKPKGKANPSIEGKLIKIDNPWHSDDYGLRLGQKLIFSSKDRYYFLTSMPGLSIPEKWLGQPFFANQDFNFTLRLYNERKIEKEGREVISLDSESEMITVDSESEIINVDSESD